MHCDTRIRDDRSAELPTARGTSCGLRLRRWAVETLHPANLTLPPQPGQLQARPCETRNKPPLPLRDASDNNSNARSHFFLHAKDSAARHSQSNCLRMHTIATVCQDCIGGAVGRRSQYCGTK